MYRSILVPLDGSVFAEHALPVALAIARRSAATLQIARVHVAPFSPIEDLGGLVDRCRGQAAGVASYLRIAPAAGSIEVGHIHYSPRLQRSPAATEAMFLMMRWAFESGYRRYEWKCDALNAASRAAAQRLGLSFEGVFRRAAVYKGRNRDTAWYAAIDAEWPALREAFRALLDPSNFDGHGRQRTRLTDRTRPLLKQCV